MTQRAKNGTPLAERFWTKVRKTDDCWYWTAAVDLQTGYGRISPDRSGTSGRGPSLAAHRVAYELSYGPIPEGLCVLHRCDNRVCVRPDHLWLGTIADNNRDMLEKDRFTHIRAFGEQHGNAKLTDEQVREIRSLYRKGSHQYGSRGLAKMFGVNHSTIISIVLRKAWRHVLNAPNAL